MNHRTEIRQALGILFLGWGLGKAEHLERLEATALILESLPCEPVLAAIKMACEGKIGNGQFCPAAAMIWQAADQIAKAENAKHQAELKFLPRPPANVVELTGQQRAARLEMLRNLKKELLATGLKK